MVYRVSWGIYQTLNDISMTFLNHFQLTLCYDVSTEILSKFWKDKATHIFYHIQEWHRWKRLIKAFILPKFLLEWFLKSLLPYIAKDVSTSRVQNEEQAIFRVQELDLIYAQSGLLYEIIPNAPRSSFDPKVKPGPHADGIVGCAQSSTNQSASGQATASSHPTQTANVHAVQMSDQKGNHQPKRNKNKGKNNFKGGNRNENANTNDKNA